MSAKAIAVAAPRAFAVTNATNARRALRASVRGEVFRKARERAKEGNALNDCQEFPKERDGESHGEANARDGGALGDWRETLNLFRDGRRRARRCARDGDETRMI